MKGGRIVPVLGTYLYSLGIFLMTACGPQAPNFLVSNVSEFYAAVSNAAPGDTITLANGEWTDADLLFDADGRSDAPILLQAQEAGKVILSGRSRLRIAGQYLVVSGLSFRDGQTPGPAVIEFRKDPSRVASFCRVTNCLIEDYNQADRYQEDAWVLLYGKRNRFDHNAISGKKNIGPTLAVRINDLQDRQNQHYIDHNYFGPRPCLGADGGETIEIGSSASAMFASNTIIEENFFEHCNGETELLALRASDNVVRRNTFLESEGTVALGDGQRNLVYENFFLGNRKPESGGVRIAGRAHHVFNNYFFGLTGEGHRAALAIMNGVENPLPDQHGPAADCIIANNTFIDCDHVQFGVGSDYEKNASPDNILIANNLFFNESLPKVFETLDEIDGFSFVGNVDRVKRRQYLGRGFQTIDPGFGINAYGIYAPTNPRVSNVRVRKFEFIENDITGVRREGQLSAGVVQVENGSQAKPWATKLNSGPYWSVPSAEKIQRGTGAVIKAGTEAGQLQKAIEKARPGDIVELTSPGTYRMENTLIIDQPLVIRARRGLTQRPRLSYGGKESGYAFIELRNGADLMIDGLAFEGISDDGHMVESAIRSSRQPMIEHYKLFVNNSEFYRFRTAANSAFKAYRNTFADTLLFNNCAFYDITGTAIDVAAETNDLGQYNAETVIIDNCIFRNISGPALDLYRGGFDHNTTGPTLLVDHSIFDNVNNRELGTVLRLLGVQQVEVRNSIFFESGRGGRSIKLEESRQHSVNVHHCNFYRAGEIESFYDDVTGRGMKRVNPGFIAPDKLDYRVSSTSGLVGRADDGNSIGLRR